jgi:hypothetical protein
MALAIALCGAGCSDDDGDTTLGDSRRPAQSLPETTEGTATTDATDTEATDGGGTLGSGTGDVATFGTGAPVALRVDVTRLERNGDLVELAMTLTNEDDELEFEPAASFVDPEFATATVYDISGVRLIDQGDRKAYLPVIDSAGVCLCSGNLFNVTIPPGDSIDLDASFGGIPASVTTLDLDVPGLTTVAGLPVGD